MSNRRGGAMRLVFVSNYFNHHQQPVSDRLFELCENNGGSYTFIQTEPMEEERLKMGWGEVFQNTSYLKNYWQEPEVCQQLIDEADAVIFGGTDEEGYIASRLKAGRLIIRYSERLYKTGRYKFVSPRGLVKKFLDHTRYGLSKVYLLCSGAYVAGDFRLVLAYPFKKYKYGYFPACKKYDIDTLMEAKSSAQSGVVELLWAARMIDWKHPEVPIKLVRKLKESLILDQEIRYHLTMVGSGPLEEKMHRLAEELQVADLISFVGSQNPEQVRKLMERADIYLATSDYGEGWGAVINEAMNSGCAVVANKAMGAVPYLIDDCKNGYWYKNKDVEMLAVRAGMLIMNEAVRKDIGIAAYKTITEEWNGTIAADRVFRLAEDLLAGRKPVVYETGPLSRCRLY